MEKEEGKKKREGREKKRGGNISSMCLQPTVTAKRRPGPTIPRQKGKGGGEEKRKGERKWFRSKVDVNLRRLWFFIHRYPPDPVAGQEEEKEGRKREGKGGVVAFPLCPDSQTRAQDGPKRARKGEKEKKEGLLFSAFFRRALQSRPRSNRGRGEGEGGGRRKEEEESLGRGPPVNSILLRGLKPRGSDQAGHGGERRGRGGKKKKSCLPLLARLGLRARSRSSGSGRQGRRKEGGERKTALPSTNIDALTMAVWWAGGGRGEKEKKEGGKKAYLFSAGQAAAECLLVDKKSERGGGGGKRAPTPFMPSDPRERSTSMRPLRRPAG